MTLIYEIRDILFFTQKPYIKSSYFTLEKRIYAAKIGIKIECKNLSMGFLMKKVKKRLFLQFLPAKSTI